MLKRICLYMLFLILAACAALPGHFVNIESKVDFPLDEIIRQIEDQKVIFIGELHAEAVSQKVEFEVIKHLYEKGKRLTIAVEIFPASAQDALYRWVKGDISRKDFAVIFEDTVHLPYSAYEDIFDYAKTMGIPIFGIDADKPLIANASKNGTGTVPPDLLQNVKFSDCSANPEYAGVLGFSGERQYHQSGMQFLCDGQRLRDAVMAFNLSTILKEDQKATVIVLTGMMHTLKIAVPQMLQAHEKVPYKALMPYKIRNMISREPDAKIADYVWY